MDRQSITHNIVLGTRDDGAIVILEDTFRYSDDFIGATGAEVYPVTDDMIRGAMAEKRDYLRELADEIDAHGESRRQIMAMPKSEYLEHRFETYPDLSRESIAAALGTDVPERYILSSIGRIFPRALEGITLRGVTASETAEVHAALAAIAEHGDGPEA